MNFLSKLPSSEYLYKSVISTFTRFPLVSLCAIFGTIMAISLAESEDITGQVIEQKLLMIAALGLPLFIALTVFGESEKWTGLKVLLPKAAAAAALAVYYFSLPDGLTGIHFIRFGLLLLGVHLLVAFMPFLRGKETAGFWQFNKSLFMRALLAAIYAGVLYVGLAIALAAADHLFGMEVQDHRYFQLWILVVGICLTGIFLAGIPDNLRDLNDSVEYPKGLKIFTQYILLPLVTLYFIILIAYEAKIIFTWNWPKGLVSHLVLWYSVVGMFSMLMLHPLRKQTGNLWIQGFFKWFFLTLIPLVVMLILAILRRISDYGITENRYFVLGLAVGLSLVVLYFVFSRRRDIRLIPVVLCCLAFLSAYGPWSAFAVSKSSQLSRLEKLLIANNLLVEGQVQRATEKLPFEHRKDMSSILDYLITAHGLETVSPWFAESMLVSLDTLPGYRQAGEVAEFIGFEFVSRRQQSERDEYLSLSREVGRSLALNDYDFLIDFEVKTANDSVLAVEIGDDSCYLRIDPDRMLLEIRVKSDSGVLQLSLTEPVLGLIDVENKKALLAEKMTFFMPGDRFNALVVFSDITGRYNEDKLDDISLSGAALIQMR